MYTYLFKQVCILFQAWLIIGKLYSTCTNNRQYFDFVNICLFCVGNPDHVVDGAVDVYAFGMCALEVWTVWSDSLY